MLDDELRRLSENKQFAPQSDCISDGDLAGLLMPEAAIRLMKHVSDCDRCGERLRLLIGSTHSSITANEAILVDLLCRPEKGSTAHRQIYRRIQFRRGFAIAASLVLGLSLIAWWVQNRPEPKAKRLLAQAYSAHRSFAWRLSDDGWAPAVVRRGEEAGSLPLLEAEAILKRSSDDSAKPSWLRLKADAKLLEFRPDQALQLLDRALAVSPQDPEILIDLAVTYALRAESQNRGSDYGAALEYATRALQSRPTPPRALFNRALILERLGILDQATADWETYLRSDPEGGWSREAREHLRVLRELKNRRSEKLRRKEESDAAFEEAAVDWLVTDRKRASRIGTKMLARYGDGWLLDASRERARSNVLGRATDATQRGRFGETLAASQAALREYSGAAPAHRLRSSLEEVFAMNRLSDSINCIEHATSLIHALRGTTYHWIRTQAMMYRASCLDMSGNAGRSVAEHNAARAEAVSHGLEGLELRAIGTLSSSRINGGDLGAAWNENRDALLRLVRSGYSANRIQQCLVNYAISSEKRGWFAASTISMLAATELLAGTRNQSTEAAGRARVAALAWKAGLRDEAEHQSRLASSLFAQLGDSATLRLYRNSVTLIQGDALLQLGQPIDALRLIEPLAGTFKLSRESWRAHQLMGTALIDLGRTEEARPHLTAALEENEKRASSLLTAGTRAAARREGIDSYRKLAQIHVERGDYQEALRVWLLAQNALVPPSVTFLVLNDGYAVWSRYPTPSFRRLRIDRKWISDQIRVLLLEASDPASDIAGIQRRGESLYHAILEPVISAPGPHSLSILPDGELAAAPFSLLMERQHWLAEQYDIAITGRDRQEASLPPIHTALVAGNALIMDPLPSLPELDLESNAVRRVALQTLMLSEGAVTLDRIRSALPNADLFHFAGHGFSSRQAGGLFLADGVLTADSIRNLRLERCKLAVLSSCASASGEEFGLSNSDSLVRALLDAGAGSVIASRWPVDSAATFRLMERFYAELPGKSPAAALALASAQLRTDTRYVHPYYWAPFQTYQ